VATGHHGLRYYVDESLMGLGKTLAVARKDVAYPGHRSLPELKPGAKDPEWMPVVAAYGLVAIVREKRLRTRPGERELVGQHGLRVVRLAPRQDMSTWEYLRLLLRHWDAIEEFIAEHPGGPWFLRVRPLLGIQEQAVFSA
jgi:PIN domain-containing protein